MLINGIKFACNTCVKGHRSSNCNHIERPLFEIRKKGRPVTQCSFCRDLRKTRQIHIKCTCTDKTKNIENTATLQQQKQQCYQCPSAKSFFSEDQNGSSIAYSDLIQIDGQQDTVIPASSTSSSSSPPPPSHCTCHETATKILYTKENWNSSSQQQHLDNNTPIIPVRSRGMMLEDNASAGLYNFQKSHSSSSLRFLGGQTKSPRRRSSLTRRSSTNSSSNSRRSTISHPSGTTTANASIPFHMNQQDDMMIDMQSFLLTDQFNQQHIRETESENAVVNNSNLTASAAVSATTGYNVSSASSTSSSNLSSHSPNSIHADMMGNNEFQGQSSDELGGFMMTDPDELTTLLNNVLMNSGTTAAASASSSGTGDANNSNSNKNLNRTRTSAGIDMTRSTTTSSSSSQPQFHHQQQQQSSMLCGSFTPHSNCSPASSIMEQQGESVVITITPLSNLLSNQEQRVVVAKEKPAVTRIVTCYCGNSCICPGCFVHPNNNYRCLYNNNNNDVPPPYMQQHQQQIQQQVQQVQQQQQQQVQPSHQIIMQYQLPSNNSSLYSSDDEDPSVNNNYQATTTTF